MNFWHGRLDGARASLDSIRIRILKAYINPRRSRYFISADRSRRTMLQPSKVKNLRESALSKGIASSSFFHSSDAREMSRLVRLSSLFISIPPSMSLLFCISNRMRYQTISLLWQRDGSPSRGCKYTKSRRATMADAASQQQQPPPPPTEEVSEPERLSKVPTGLASQPVNIVILGASYAGLSVAHHFLDHTINHLRITKAAPNYRLVLINPSTHLYWNIGAPRALVKPDLIKTENLFIPIEPGFHRHRGHNFSIIQGEAVALDTSARNVTVELIGSTAQKRASQVNKRNSGVMAMQQQGPKVQTIAYHALIMATGTSAHSDLLSLHGPHLHTQGALNAFHARIAAAKRVIVCGGGCSGVETAAQLATFLNYKSHWPIKKRVKRPKKIILITGSDRCLPSQKPKVGMKAEKMLDKLGVEIRHNVRVIAAKEGFDLTGQTKVELNDDTFLIADLYVACTGVTPSTAYIPPELRDSKGYILTQPSTLRVDAGPRVYALGDCASYSRNCVQDVYAAVPVLMHNLLNDLLAHEYHLASPYGGNQDKFDDLEDQRFESRSADSQLCPISRFGGVGVLMGMAVPGLVVWALKGRDYLVRKTSKVVESGRNPYAFKGKYE